MTVHTFRTRRLRWGVPALALVVAACGGGSAGDHREPLDDPDCSTAAERFSDGLPVGLPGQTVRIAETKSGQWFCLGDGSGDDMTIGLDSSPEAVATPAVTDSGSWNGPGQWYLFVLPSDLPDGLDVVALDDGGLVFARTADGDHLLLIDYTADAQRDPDQDVPRTWQMLDPSGTVVLELNAIGPPAGSAPPTVAELHACLEEHGLSREAQQPYPPEVAEAGWRQCRNLDIALMEASGMSPDEVAEMIAFVDCMATRGYIQEWVDPYKIDVAAHDTASTACMNQPSGDDPFEPGVATANATPPTPPPDQVAGSTPPVSYVSTRLSDFIDPPVTDSEGHVLIGWRGIPDDGTAKDTLRNVLVSYHASEEVADCIVAEAFAEPPKRLPGNPVDILSFTAEDFAEYAERCGIDIGDLWTDPSD